MDNEFYEYDYEDYYSEEDDTPCEEPIQDVPKNEVPVPEPTEKEDDNITKDLLDILKAVTQNSEEDTQEVTGGDSDPEQIEEPETENEEPIQTEIVTSDYSEILEEIKNEITSGNADISEQNLLLTQYIDDNKPDTPIDNLSVTNLLLVLIFILLLIQILVKLIRGLF